jgi:hypothetical protein
MLLPRFGRRLHRRALRLASAILVTLAFASPADAQSSTEAPTSPAPQPGGQALVRVFLDCDICDEIYLRQNVTFVEYVRDRAVAEVHVLVTPEPTGGGGTLWTLSFLGQGRFAGQDRTLRFSTLQTASSDDRRRELARLFQIGIVGYAAESPAVDRLEVTWRGNEAAADTPAHDPWRFWVFRVNGNGSANGQASSRSRSYRMSGSANRVTEAWKVSLGGGRSTTTSRYNVGEDETVNSRRESWNLDGLIVRSLTGQWSAGTRLAAEHSSFSNTDLSLTIAPGVEFDFFPYAESSRRSLTLQYSIGASRLKYKELTVFDRLSESVPHHALAASLGLRQPWGSLGTTASVSQHLNHLDRRRLSVFGNTDVRLFKGFSFNLFGEYVKISDQIALRKGDATTEEVLLSLQQLQTNYSYYLSFGLSYSFGSIFNSIVNPRFNGSGALSF